LALKKLKRAKSVKINLFFINVRFFFSIISYFYDTNATIFTKQKQMPNSVNPKSHVGLFEILLHQLSSCEGV
jgi:hypothetical protein